MHACGHDGHVAIALAAAGRLERDPASRPLRFLFQPAEERGGGARACVADGAMEGVSAAIGLHLWNQLSVGKVGVHRGAMMAAVDEFQIDVEGRGGHGAAPHETSDPIVAAARIVDALQTVVSREVSPLDSAVVTIASIHGGDAFNVIPSTVRLTGITTKQWDGSTYTPVDTYSFAQSMPAPGDGTAATLWLQSITRTGGDTSTGGAAVALDCAQFSVTRIHGRTAEPQQLGQ